MQKTILFITNSGIGLYSFRFELIEALRKQNFVVKLAYSGIEKRNEFEKIGCECFNIPFDSSSTNPVSEILLFKKFENIINNTKPDIALLYTIKPCIYAGLLLRIKRIPYITTVTGISPALICNKIYIRLITEYLSRIGYNGSDVIYFQNKMNEELFTKLKIGLNKHVLIAGSGVNLDKFTPITYPEDEDTVKLLYIGRLKRIKGIEELSYAIKKAKNLGLNINCKIVGELGDNLPLFEQALKEGIIDYEGPTDNVKQYISWCNALVLPSYGEGMSNVLQEASACGRPILASNIPGCKEIFEEGITGYGFLPKNGDSLFDAILKFYSIPYETKKIMGIRACEKMKKEFDRKQIVEIYVQKIMQVIGGNT